MISKARIFKKKIGHFLSSSNITKSKINNIITLSSSHNHKKAAAVTAGHHGPQQCHTGYQFPHVNGQEA